MKVNEVSKMNMVHPLEIMNVLIAVFAIRPLDIAAGLKTISIHKYQMRC